MEKRKDPKSRTIRALATGVQVAALAAVVLAFFASVWIGAGAVVLWLLFSEVLPIAVLGPFFGVGRVRDAMWRHMINEPNQPGSQTGLERFCGKVGRACTELDPEGYVSVEGERYAARSEHEPLAEGTEVVVVDARLGRLAVVPRERAERSASHG